MFLFENSYVFRFFLIFRLIFLIVFVVGVSEVFRYVRGCLGTVAKLRIATGHAIQI